MDESVQLSLEEAVRLAARDIPTFGQIWLPKTFRSPSPPMHFDMSAKLEDPRNRLVGLKVFRDGAKTTIIRTHMLKRIAYRITRTGMFVNINSTKAEHSLRWIKKQILFNKPFTDAYGLRPGDKWTDNWISIVNREGEVSNVVAAGITSGLRGLNIDDFRPDFIGCDDISDRENTATQDQREKANEAFFQQLYKSLAPELEMPLAQLALAQTPINPFDIITQASSDPQFEIAVYGCFDEAGQSRWGARRSTESLMKEKEGFIRRNMLHAWMAEMECTLVSAESQAFNVDWLRFWDVYPEDGKVFIVLDPASSEEKTADFFAVVVLLFWKQRVYVLDYIAERGLMPDKACNKIFEFAQQYNCRDVIVETVAYQRIMAWYLEKEMKERRVWLNIKRVDDKRRKDDRITQSIIALAPYGNLFVRSDMVDLIQQFTLFGPGYKDHIDILDAVSLGIMNATGYSLAGNSNEALEAEFRRLREEDESLDDGGSFQGAP